MLARRNASVMTLQVVIRFFLVELLSFTSVPSSHDNRRSSLVIAFLLLTPKLLAQFQSEQLRNYVNNQL